MRTRTLSTITEVRLNDIRRRDSSWLLAVFDHEIEAIQAASEALDPEHSNYQRTAKYAFIITQTAIGRKE